MKMFGRWTTAALMSALLVALPACGAGDRAETEEMEALLLDELDAEQGDASQDGEALDGEAGGSGGSAEGQERGFGDPETGSVDLNIPQREEPAPRPRPATPAPQPEPEPEPEIVVRAGTQLALSMDLEISTEHALPGDPVTATVTDDVIAPDGMVLIPRGAQLLGRVVRSEESPDSDTDPVLEVEFETLSTALWERAVRATVVEAEMESSRKDSDKETAAKIGGAAAAGAILGKVLGKDTEDAVKGGVAGAVAGTVIAMETRAGHAKIKEGALIVIELMEALVLE